MHRLRDNTRGMTLLLVVVVIGAAALLFALNTTILGLGELDLGYSAEQGSETFSLADGCMEEALRQLQIDSGYTGGSLSLGDGSCILSVQASSTNRIITVTSTIGAYTSALRMDVDIDTVGTITVNDWAQQ